MNHKVGDVVEGKIVHLIKIGAFVDIGEEKNGFVHISEMAHDYINMPSDIVSVGDVVKVEILNIADDGKIGLSIKRTVPKLKNDNEYYNKNETFRDKTKNKQDSFEAMMKKFQSISDEKLSDLKKYINTKQRKGKK